MNKRRLGQTGLQVSEIGFGSWPLGNDGPSGVMSDADALNLVAAARERGCNLFDTAPNYAATNSERLLGQALKGQRDQVVLVSKFGHRPDDDSNDFSADWFWRNLEQSLERLQTDYLDVLLAHSPPLEVLNGDHEIWDALRQARQEGKIRFYGASIDYAHEVNAVLDSTDVQVLELLFNVLHQDVRRSFDRIRDNDVGVITKVPLDSGWLSGEYTSSSRFSGIRARWTDDDIATRAKAVDRVKDILRGDTPLAQLALAYLLSYDQVSTVIPGIRTMQQLESNFAADGKRLPDEVKKQLEECWGELTNQGRSLLPW
jgi:aryl-alcohol dehydrogenase-like predicted oxidoreductase